MKILGIEALNDVHYVYGTDVSRTLEEMTGCLNPKRKNVLQQSKRFFT